jgi:PAS domain S-box-containing protein
LGEFVAEIERPEWVLQMQEILETLNEGVVIRDDCNRVIFANTCFTEMIGVPLEDLLGRQAADIFPPEDAEKVNQHVARAQKDGHHRFEFYLPKRGGGRLPVVIGARILEDPDGRFFAVVTFTDISEQKRVETSLIEANEKLEERYREIEQDLVLAARVQQSLAPHGLTWGAVEVAAYYHPVWRIGGDFGLVVPSTDDHLNLVVCDVSGHGIGSALVANRIYTETMSQLERSVPLREMFRHLNAFVKQSLGSSVLYFTMAAARVDRSGRMVYAAAGHPPAMLVRPGEQPRLLPSRSMILGLLDEAVDVEATMEIPLEPGDRLVLYTDGLDEAFSATGEFLGVEGLREIVGAAANLPFGEMKESILDRVAAYRDGPAADDVSLVLLEMR